ncbi:Myb-like DNA-binding domain protein [Moelleriella libera RCEF 2490]|uniref:Myb-like DNA-binding domain protein n=1 Tax=Moelleriella libera RCEF 2490 TaxID=1081109 RepID=A0A167Z2P3_9HYPO|nr:Myb-like DNA-binding domain protein [Moelleriella libera RCEF 2490]
MEPAFKRRRLNEPVQACADADPEDEGGEWEEYDGDDDTDTARLERQKGDFAEEDDSYQLAIVKAYADERFRAKMDHIFKKYGRDFEGIGDEIDLDTGEIVVNNGHIENMRNEVDVGIPGEMDEDTVSQVLHEDDDSSTIAEDDDDDDGDDCEEGDEVAEEEAGNSRVLREFVAAEPAPGPSHEVGDNGQFVYTPANAHWTSDDEEVEVAPDYMQVEGAYPDPDSLDIVPGYGYPAIDQEGPTLISGLYQGGGLRYATSQGEFGGSPFALGPWEMLPPSYDRFDYSRQDSLGAPRSDYSFRNVETGQRSAARIWPGELEARKLKALPPAKMNEGDGQESPRQAGQSANFFELYPEEGAALYGSTVEKANNHPSERHAPNSEALPGVATEDSDTAEDPVFSGGEIDVSSQTGDEVARPRPGSTSDSRRVIADSQDTAISPDDASEQLPVQAAPPVRQLTQRDFDLACMLSDDEAPIIPHPAGGIKRPLTALQPNAVPINSRSVSDGSALKRGRGRPRKYPLQEVNGKLVRVRPRKKKCQPHPQPLASSHSAAEVICLGEAHGPGQQPHIPGSVSSKVTGTSTADQMGASLPSEKRKRGRPRKQPSAELPGVGTTPETAQAPPTQPSLLGRQFGLPVAGQPFYYGPYPHVLQPQAFQYPYATAWQQPFLPFPQFAPPFAYSTWPQTYPQLPNDLLQHSAVNQAAQQKIKQHPLLLQPNTIAGKEQQPVKRGRGRPRKYPVGYKRCRKRVQIPALQNSMTALLSGHHNRTAVSEDAWYGVARRLAADISCLQTGYMVSNGLKAQTVTYVSPRRKARPPSQSYRGSGSSAAESKRCVPSGDRSRVIEVMSNTEMSPLRPQAAHVDHTSSSDEPESSESEFQSEPESESGSGSGSESGAESATYDDERGNDEGFAMPESPSPSVDAAQSISSPRPLASTRETSPLCQSERALASSISRLTPDARPRTPPQILNRKTPSPGKDVFSLPTSPASVTKRIPAPIATLDHEDAVASRNSLDNWDTDGLEMPDFVDDDSQSPRLDRAASALVRSSPQNHVSQEELRAPLTPKAATTEESDTLRNGSPSNLVAASAKRSPILPKSPSISRVNVLATPRKPSSDHASSPIFVEDEQRLDSTKINEIIAPTPIVLPPAVNSSSSATPQKSGDHTPSEEYLSVLAKTPPRKEILRSPMVPRSAERCTPVYKTVAPSPTKPPIIKERRTMGEIRQAIMAPLQKPRASTSVMPNLPSSRPASHGTQGLGRHSEPSFVRKPLSKPPAATRESTSLTSSRGGRSSQHLFQAAHKPLSRRPRPSLPNKSKRNEGEDESDELAENVQSKSSSVKPARPFISSKIARDSKRKMRKPSPVAMAIENNGGGKPDKHKAKSKEERKRRRHTDGDADGRNHSAGSAGGSQVCGVDGYTCNRDFCFTCL